MSFVSADRTGKRIAWRLANFVAALLLSFLGSCSHPNNIYDSVKIISDASIKYGSINLAEVVLDSINTSGVSISAIDSDGDICYYDRYFSWVYKFDSNGHLLGRYLGHGRGPKESIMRRGTCFSESSDGHWALYGTSLEFELYDSDLNIINRFQIPYVREPGEAKSFFSYTFFPPSPTARLYKDRLYIKSYGNDEQFNYLTDNRRYLKEARHIAVVDMMNGEALPMMLPGFPSMYGKDAYKYAAFEYVNFDVDDRGRFFVNFEADSLLYVFDNKFRPINAFGFSGKNMDQSYEETRSWTDDRDAAMRNRFERGYYTNVEYIDETGICFRSYQKGKHSEYDGLQIYKDGVLLGDCDVPKGLKVIGYIAPYYYSQVYDEDDGDRLYIYRFSL